MVADNGTCFVSSEMEALLMSNGVKHLTSTPYHPSSKGLAKRDEEKGIRTGSMKSRLSQILFAYWLTPQTTTGVPPSELLLERCPRSRLDLVKPYTAEQVEKKQIEQKVWHDSKVKASNFNVGDKVSTRNFHLGERWLPGMIKQRTGPV